QVFNINTFRVVNRGIPFGDANYFASVLFRKKLCGVVAYIAKPLKDDGFAFQTGRQTKLSQILGVTKSLTNTELDAPAGGLPAAMNAALGHRFSRYTGKVVDATRIKAVVGIRHPGHFALTGADVGTWNVFAWSDIAFTNQFRRKPARDLFDLFFAVFFRIESDS